MEAETCGSSKDVAGFLKRASVCDLAEVEQHAEEGRVLHQLHGLGPRRAWTGPLGV